jgi:hypothetical protein
LNESDAERLQRRAAEALLRLMDLLVLVRV